MNFGLSESQQTLKNTARQFLAAECPIASVRKLIETDTALDPVLWKKMADQGWTGIIFPEESGGFGMGLVEMVLVLEEMGRALLPGPYLSTVLLAGSIIELAGSGAQKQRYLQPICAGQAKSTLALLEASASWDPHCVLMQALRRGDGFSLHGRKLLVPDAAVADFIVVTARLNGESALFVLPSNAEGLCIRATPGIDGTRKLSELLFDSVTVPAEGLLAAGERARVAMEHALAVSTVGLVAEMVGGMQRLLETTVAYAKTRKQFGRPIGQFQAVQHLCADMLLLTESSRSASYYAAWALNEEAPGTMAAVSVAKAYASEAYREVGNRAIQVHGGMGFTWESDLHLYYRRAKASEVAFGDAAWHRERVAKLIVDRREVRQEVELAAVGL